MKRPDAPLPAPRLPRPPLLTETPRFWSRLEPARRRRLAHQLAELIRRLPRRGEEQPREHL